jgi:hypothetical protein
MHEEKRHFYPVLHGSSGQKSLCLSTLETRRLFISIAEKFIIESKRCISGTRTKTQSLMTMDKKIRYEIPIRHNFLTTL